MFSTSAGSATGAIASSLEYLNLFSPTESAFRFSTLDIDRFEVIDSGVVFPCSSSSAGAVSLTGVQDLLRAGALGAGPFGVSGSALGFVFGGALARALGGALSAALVDALGGVSPSSTMTSRAFEPGVADSAGGAFLGAFPVVPIAFVTGALLKNLDVDGGGDVFFVVLGVDVFALGLLTLAFVVFVSLITAAVFGEVLGEVLFVVPAPFPFAEAFTRVFAGAFALFLFSFASISSIVGSSSSDSDGRSHTPFVAVIEAIVEKKAPRGRVGARIST